MLRRRRLRSSWWLSRRLVQIALSGWFLYQCVVSLNKLLERRVGTAESSDHEEVVIYPSVTLCDYREYVEDDPAPMSLDEAYEALEPVGARVLKLNQGPFIDRYFYYL